ncbi:MAG: FtsX-like permease family protein, partial [Bdellovibrionales bacterium]|nr:FtsX-like permease family protein [Bdellovibrionales bacterium]
VLRWDELLPGLKQAIELDMASGWLFYFSLVLIVTFSIVNTFFMVVVERTREFSIMLALGVRPSRIGGLVVLESMLLTTLGLLLGIGCGAVTLWYFGVHGFSVPGMDEVAKLWNLPDAIYTRITPRALLHGPLVLLGMSVLAVIFPVLKIFRLNPSTSLRQG